MVEQRPDYRISPRDLSAPTEKLKLIGRPEVEDNQALQYSVRLELSRKLSAGEQDYVGLGNGIPSPAGMVYVEDDLQHLIVNGTTIEQVIEHQEALKALVAQIASQGEIYRRQALADREEARERAAAVEAERDRRRQLADGFSFG